MRLKPGMPRLADEISEKIRTLILEGSLQPGDRLPAERQLAEQFDTSRPTIRDALMKLENEGLLRMQRGGLHVADTMEEIIKNPLIALFKCNSDAFDDYLEFRGVIEATASSFAAIRATETDRKRLKDAFERVLHCHDEADPVKEAHADADFHVTIYEACHNLTILHVMRGMAELLRNDVFYNRNTLYPQAGYRDATIDQHRAIYKAIMARNADAAKKAAEAHISFVRHTLDELKKANARQEISQRRAEAGARKAFHLDDK